MPKDVLITDDLKRRAIADGYKAGAASMESTTELPETYKHNTFLLFCWQWGYKQAKSGDVIDCISR